jgi:hypothetical protein
VTGTTKYVKRNFDSALNNASDISLNPKFGALMGFTYDEIKRYYLKAIKQVAKSRKVTNEEILEEMKLYYNVFCFDGETFVYNPFSILRFFEEKNLTISDLTLVPHDN